MIEIKPYHTLHPATLEIIELQVKKEFGEVEIVQRLDWAKPTWSAIKYEGDQIVSFCNLIERVIIIDSKEYLAVGINNMITPEAHRGNGFASEVLRECERFIYEEPGFDFGLLLCADTMVPFYEKHDWYKVKCPVYFKQAEYEQLWSANTMLLSQSKIKPDNINLNGLPW